MNRMLQWLIIAILFHIIAIIAATSPYPQLSTIFWKLGNMTIAAWVGFWIDRHVFRDRLDNHSLPMRQVRRAVIIASAMISVSLGA